MHDRCNRIDLSLLTRYTNKLQTACCGCAKSSLPLGYDPSRSGRFRFDFAVPRYAIYNLFVYRVNNLRCILYPMKYQHNSCRLRWKEAVFIFLFLGACVSLILYAFLASK